jgi:hypothetical protein
MARFSKKVLTEYIQGQIWIIQRCYGFEPIGGLEQVPYIAQDANLSESTVLAAYSKLELLRNIAKEFGLNIDLLPSEFISKPIGG